MHASPQRDENNQGTDNNGSGGKDRGGNRFGRIDKYMTLIEMTDSYIQNKHQREVNNLNNQINDLNNTIERLRDELREKDTVVCRQCQPSELERDR